MPKSQVAKSTARRLPLRNLSNGGPHPSESHRSKRHSSGPASDVVFDHLLLACSDLTPSSLRLMKWSLKLFNATVPKSGNQVIESFGRFLSDTNSSLKHWSSRLKQAFEASQTESEVSQNAPWELVRFDDKFNDGPVSKKPILSHYDGPKEGSHT